MSKLPTGWALLRPTELASSEQYSLSIGPFGSDLRVSDYREAGVPLVFVRNIRREGFHGVDTNYVSLDKAARLRAHEVRPGDILITKMGDPPGDSTLYPPNRPVGIITADCIRWRVPPQHGNARYFMYALRTSDVRQQMLNITQGVAQKKISLERFRTISIPSAPLPEQHRIVAAIDDHFSRLDEAVVLLERVQRNLKRHRASVLKAAVEGRLVPTEAALASAEGRTYEPASVLLGRILDERRRRWKAEGGRGAYKEPVAPDTTDLPELPEGWCWTTVDQLGVVTGGLTKNAKREGLRTSLPYLRVANVYANELRLEHVESIGIEESEVDRVLLRAGDLLVVEGNGSIDQIGRVALWDGSIQPCVHQNHIIKVRFIPVALAGWVLEWLLSPGGRLAIQNVASSTSGLHTLSISKVALLPVPLCPLAEQGRVRTEVDRLLSVALQTQSEARTTIARSARLRQSILKWAFEGRLADQDPADEPADVLLERIRAVRAAVAPKSTRRRRPPRQGASA